LKGGNEVYYLAAWPAHNAVKLPEALAKLFVEAASLIAKDLSIHGAGAHRRFVGELSRCRWSRL
jgi:hypothetical protein